MVPYPGEANGPAPLSDRYYFADLENGSTTWRRSTTPKAATRTPSRLAIRKKALGPDHPHVATSLNNLAGLKRYQGLTTAQG